MNLIRKGPWRFKPFDDCPAIHTDRPPCRFWRVMWWLLLGAKWEQSED